jgi:hypothetical protein
VLQLFFTTFYTILCRCTITRQLIVIKTPEIAKKVLKDNFCLTLDDQHNSSRSSKKSHLIWYYKKKCKNKTFFLLRLYVPDLCHLLWMLEYGNIDFPTMPWKKIHFSTNISIIMIPYCNNTTPKLGRARWKKPKILNALFNLKKYWWTFFENIVAIWRNSIGILNRISNPENWVKRRCPALDWVAFLKQPDALAGRAPQKYILNYFWLSYDFL